MTGLRLLLPLLLVVVAWAAPALADSVRLDNRSTPTRCAEEDNVDVRFTGNHPVSRFRIAARHPAYLGALREDQMEPDFTGCDMSGDPVHPTPPREAVLYDDGAWKLVGLNYPSFWRPARVPFTVAGRTTEGLHLVQLHKRHRDAWIEVLVVYPPDGYWRAKPLPPAHFADTGFGSSFLVGPVVDEGRPVVAFASLSYDVPARRFDLRFADGTRGTLRLTASEADGTMMEVAFDPARSGAFAALRSMFVAPDNNDTALAHLRYGNGSAIEQSVMTSLPGETTNVRFFRRVPSRHNTSAPDLGFDDFR